MYIIVAYQMEDNEAVECSLYSIVEHCEVKVSEACLAANAEPRYLNQITRAIPVEIGQSWYERLMPFSYYPDVEEVED